MSPDKPLQVKIVNKLPNGAYSTSLVVRNVEVPELPEIEALSFAGMAAPCTEIKNLKAATSESEVPRLVAALKKAIDSGTCSAGDGQEVIASTMAVSSETYTLRPGQELVLTVGRQADDANGLKKRPGRSSGPPAGAGSGTPATVLVSSRRTTKSSSPGLEKRTGLSSSSRKRIARTWRSLLRSSSLGQESRKVRDLDFGPAGGLGFDLSKPVVFVGWQFTYNQNYTLNLGLVAHPETRLDGQYEVGQVLKEALTPDKLEDDSSYGVAGFIGVSFRFGKNPFKTSGGDGK